jgi:hypothetical protein
LPPTDQHGRDGRGGKPFPRLEISTAGADAKPERTLGSTIELGKSVYAISSGWLVEGPILNGGIVET